ncbi:MAG: SOS response-associated peptidase [Burkholderiaceae bacterium]
MPERSIYALVNDRREGIESASRGYLESTKGRTVHRFARSNAQTLIAMCGRYKVEERWQEYCKLAQFDWNEPPWPTENPFKVSSAEVRPTDRMPIIRFTEHGKLIAELRRWGFILMVNGKAIDKATGQQKKIVKPVINAMSEKLTTSYMWKWTFKERRCLIPMSSWDEWPETGAGKQRVRFSMPSEPVFMAAGLYDINVDPKTGEKVPVYTMCTVPPNEFLGTVHDRAPMVLLPSQYEAWLAGGSDATALIGMHPNATRLQFSRFDCGPSASTWIKAAVQGARNSPHWRSICMVLRFAASSGACRHLLP